MEPREFAEYLTDVFAYDFDKAQRVVDLEWDDTFDEFWEEVEYYLKAFRREWEN